MVTCVLSLAGIKVVTADTASEGLNAARNGSFDLFLLDSLLPDRSGVELCADLRELFPRIPVLFYSALAFESDVRNGLDAGAEGYLIKPFNGDLAKTILNKIQDSAHLVRVTDYQTTARSEANYR
jgi:DNA-binding response OmpR family regulator